MAGDRGPCSGAVAVPVPGCNDRSLRVGAPSTRQLARGVLGCGRPRGGLNRCFAIRTSHRSGSWTQTAAAAAAATANSGGFRSRHGPRTRCRSPVSGLRSRPPDASRFVTRSSHRALVGASRRLRNSTHVISTGGPSRPKWRDPPLEAIRVSHSVGCCSLSLILSLPLSLSLKLTLSLTLVLRNARGGARHR
jgi:hypothetical protein